MCVSDITPAELSFPEELEVTGLKKLRIRLNNSTHKTVAQISRLQFTYSLMIIIPDRDSHISLFTVQNN